MKQPPVLSIHYMWSLFDDGHISRRWRMKSNGEPNENWIVRGIQLIQLSLQSSTKKQPQMMETQQSNSSNEQIAQHLFITRLE